ncbi:DUF2946 family protein [Arhodomonas sp. SL1]|uniref:DUF2946 family protein n=1 Tax=Arhodomonas sp. SL1 TaxID=3425691 RepID=UPI003F884312
MDESVRRAMARWPNVPALYGWLYLDRRGCWWINGELIERTAIIDFIGRNYVVDERGRWYFQNGPQRGYVDLEYTPWILFADGAGGLVDHTGTAVTGINAAYVDEHGDVLLTFDRGVGLLHGDVLHWFVEHLEGEGGGQPSAPALERALDDLMQGRPAGLRLNPSVGVNRPLYPLRRSQAPARFGFDPRPREVAGEDPHSG